MAMEHEKLNRQGFKDVFISSNGLKQTRGLATLISGRVIYEHREICSFKGKIDGNLFTFYNICVPPGSELNFYIQILERIPTEAERTLV